jgi:apolipoprotein N-acyltransferase
MLSPASRMRRALVWLAASLGLALLVATIRRAVTLERGIILSVAVVFFGLFIGAMTCARPWMQVTLGGAAVLGCCVTFLVLRELGQESDRHEDEP